MKIAGIVSEYNPFHNGHLYHLKKTKKITGCDGIVAVMSGNFVMRGDIAMLPKHIRAKCAVLCGADLVLELPLPYALSSAEYFAKGAISILDSLNVTDYLSFGSEWGKTDKLARIAYVLSDKKSVEKIKENSKKGMPVYQATEELFSGEDKEILRGPNNILGINYIKALKELDSKIIPVTVKREGTGYNDSITKGNIASAKHLRNLSMNNEDISSYIPEKISGYMDGFVFERDIEKMILYAVKMKRKEDLLKYKDVSEGLENLIFNSAKDCNSLNEIIGRIKSKRYTETRIKRILYNIFLDIPKHMCEKPPRYGRVLAFNEKGREIIKEIKKKSEFKIITNITKEDVSRFDMLREDIKAEKIYGLVAGKGKSRIIL